MRGIVIVVVACFLLSGCTPEFWDAMERMGDAIEKNQMEQRARDDGVRKYNEEQRREDRLRRIERELGLQ